MEIIILTCLSQPEMDIPLKDDLLTALMRQAQQLILVKIINTQQH